MARNHSWTIYVIIGLLVVGTASFAQADGWFYNPFGGSSDQSTKTVKSSKKTEPSTLQKMNQGTKEFFTGLNPFAASKSRNASSGSIFPSRNNLKPKKKDSSWNWWFSSQKEEPPQTVDDFLARERPSF
ncbi:MAG: hypothetical protein WDZ51_12695 [Pirellulaceae bacterium]